MTSPARALAALALAALALAGPASAEERFTVTPAGTGPQRLDLPPAFLSASARGDLADLRLQGAAGAEVPYLLVAPPEAPPNWAGAARIRPIPPTKTESGAEIDLGAAKEVAGLALGFGVNGFLKRARVEGSGDGQRWSTLAEGESLYALPLDPGACGGEACPGALVRQELRFQPARVRYLRVVLDDRRSPRIPPPATARALLAGAGAPAMGPVVPLEVSAREAEPGVSRFSIRLPGPHLPVRAVVLEVDAARLARRARVLEARLADGRLAPRELGSALLVAVEREGVMAGDLRIPVSAPEELELELVVEDGDSGPLPLRGARAELAPAPWVFFESKDGAPIEARLGDPGLRAPRYDLEALRSELPRLQPTRATAAAGTPAPAAARSGPVALTGGDAAAPGAALDARAFRYARAVAAGEPGLVAVRLDADVLSRSPDLSDLRLADGGGRQVPYLLEQRDAPLAVPLTEQGPAKDLPRQLEQKGVTLHALASPQPAYPASRLVLSTEARVFTREIQVWVEPDRPGARGPELLASASWSHADPARPAPSLAIPLPPFRAGRLLVAVNDGDNAPLALGGPRLLLPSYRLRFFHPGPALQLLYGGQGLAAPRYDLALLAPRLRAAAAREVALGAPPAPDAPGGGPQGTSRLLFWGALGLAVVGLLALVGRLLLKAGDGAGRAQG